MTAAAGVLTGLAKLKRQDSARSQHRPVPASSPGSACGAQEGAPRKRKRRTDVVVVRGRLRLYSASGFFLLLGLLILAAGIAMATLGYWPQSSGQSPPGGGGSKAAERALKNASTSKKVEDRPSGRPAGGALTRFLERHRHSERMKMVGPFTMGIGIFIFICANAILHENRDRETKIIHMRDMYSTVIDIHRLRQKEQKHHPEHNYPIRGLVAVSPRAGGARGASAEEEALLGDEEARGRRERAGSACSFAGLLAPLYKDRAPSEAADAETGGHRARCIVSSSISAFTLPVIKLNNCVIDEPEMEAITEEERGHGRDDESSRPLGATPSLAAPVPSVAKASKPPRFQRSNSASSSSSSSSMSSSSLALSSTSGCWLSPGAARPDFDSNAALHVLGSHSKSLDLERQASMLSLHREQRKHPSWPRLDRGNSSRSIKGYTRLEDRGDERQGGGGGGTEATPQTHLQPAAVVRLDYSKRDKLLMISRSHNNLSFEHDDLSGGTLKRGSSETRF
ncbi:transmembrane protein 200A [Phyllopteryx taeniolatus]|uniref:transmembrane protein 200A n=1 Tax=Phyllopteryx taeniolatus TaxID=161469 RepID=UPI002AD55F8A|nr:transmembrane protein 200A [Phyllopteryx taeniolatus]